jgi:hypothetical protein
VIYLQEKFSQGLNQQEEGVPLHSRGSSWDKALLTAYTYLIIDARHHIYKTVY